MLLDQLAELGTPVASVGKINDIFLGRGITSSRKTKTNADGMRQTLEAMAQTPNGLVFVNLVDFDMLFGHRNDPEGYSLALEEVDRWLPSLLAALSGDDLLIFTADHGCDPTTVSTDHSREYVPLLAYAPAAPSGVNLGTRASLSDIGQTVAENFGARLEHGASFLDALVT